MLWDFFAMAAADGKINRSELTNIYEALDTEGMTESSVTRIHSFLDQASLIQEGKLDKSDAKQALRNAAAGLSAVGVPLAALLFSCTVSGLGLADGLTGLDMGLGLAPAIGMVMLLGVATFAGVSWILGRTEAEPVSETTSRAQYLEDAPSTRLAALGR